MECHLEILLLLVCCQIFLGNCDKSLPECQEGEYHYEYTECGSDGGRWHVAVPHDAKHCSIKAKPPIRQKTCDSVCPEGQFSDVSLLSEKCNDCPKGTHSLGGAVHYENWTVLPPEFDTYSVQSYDERMRSEEDTGCNSTWIADGKFLRTHGTSCITRLTYTANIIKKEGSLTFWYYYTNENDNMYFEVFARNEQCQISRQSDGSDESNDDEEDGKDDGEDQVEDDEDDMDDMEDDLYMNPDPSSNYVWKNFTLKLKRGKNLVVWEVDHFGDARGSRFSNIVFIKDIEVKGGSSSSECVACPAGTFAANVGSAWCEPCPENQISSKPGSFECKSCDKKTEYAPSGNSKCLKRPPCKKSDYFETSSKCDKDNKLQTVYKWIEPKICSDAVKDAAKLPSPKPKQPCPSCNPGMYLNDTNCLLCPSGTISDGKKPCEKCPASTAAVLKHDYRFWRSWPSSSNHWCSSYAKGCTTSGGWNLRGSYLDSGLGHSDDVALFFEVKTVGFAGERGLVSRTAKAVGSIRIEFELDCDGPCTFVMYEINANHGTTEVGHWNGRETRQNYTYAATSKEGLIYRWKFTKQKFSTYRPTEKMYRHINDRVKIYAVFLSNTVDGGGATCRECPIGSHESGCVKCPEGHYVNNQTKKCIACRKGTYFSKDTCVKCGPGLTSEKASTKCFSSCHYHATDGRHLDFSKMKGVHVAQTQRSFFSEGTPFIYEYRLSLCGADAPVASCHNNASFLHKQPVVRRLNASICQMRIIPGKKNGPALATGMAGIGHQLMGIYEDKPENVSLDVFQDEKLSNESLLYLDFLSHSTTPSCPTGRSAWIILRCDTNSNENGTIKFPPACHEGTCDGCKFLFLWHTKYACPLCTEDHYYEIESGCVNKKKRIHYSWKTMPRNCIDGITLPKLKELPCSEMSVHEAVQQFRILIGIVAFVLTAILASICFLWYKNRVLKYKLYHRVAGNDSQQADELPQAESCMPDEDEELDEKVEFRKGGNSGQRLLKKLKDISNTGKDESMKLSDSFEVDLN